MSKIARGRWLPETYGKWSQITLSVNCEKWNFRFSPTMFNHCLVPVCFPYSTEFRHELQNFQRVHVTGIHMGKGTPIDSEKFKFTLCPWWVMNLRPMDTSDDPFQTPRITSAIHLEQCF